MRVRRSLSAAVVVFVAFVGVGGVAAAQGDSIAEELLRSLGLDDHQIADARHEVDALLVGLADAGILDEEDWALDGDQERSSFEERFRVAAEEWDDLRDEYLDEDDLARWDEIRDDFAGCVELGDDPVDCGPAVHDDFSEVWSGVDDHGDGGLFGDDFDGDFFDDGWDPEFEDGWDPEFGDGWDPEFGDGWDPEFGDGWDPEFEDGWDPEFEDGWDPEFEDGWDDPEFAPPVDDGWDDPEFAPPVDDGWDDPEFAPPVEDGWDDPEFAPPVDDGWDDPELAPPVDDGWDEPPVVDPTFEEPAPEEAP